MSHQVILRYTPSDHRIFVSIPPIRAPLDIIAFLEPPPRVGDQYISSPLLSSLCHDPQDQRLITQIPPYDSPMSTEASTSTSRPDPRSSNSRYFVSTIVQKMIQAASDLNKEEVEPPPEHPPTVRGSDRKGRLQKKNSGHPRCVIPDGTSPNSNPFGESSPGSSMDKVAATGPVSTTAGASDSQDPGGSSTTLAVSFSKLPQGRYPVRSVTSLLSKATGQTE
jgi:hypothetical protein